MTNAQPSHLRLVPPMREGEPPLSAKAQFGLREKNKRSRKDARSASRRAKQAIVAREAAAFQRLLDGAAK